MEANLRRCKVCAEEKMRILSGRYPTRQNKKWADSSGKLWNGNICPECHQKNQAALVKEKRAKKI